jgi:hypothetical protein
MAEATDRSRGLLPFRLTLVRRTRPHGKDCCAKAGTIGADRNSGFRYSGWRLCREPRKSDVFPQARLLV